MENDNEKRRVESLTTKNKEWKNIFIHMRTDGQSNGGHPSVPMDFRAIRPSSQQLWSPGPIIAGEGHNVTDRNTSPRT